MTPKLARILHLVLRILLSLAFLAAGLPKFLPQSGWRERFAGWGYPAWFVLVIGALEVAGVIGLWVPRTCRTAMALLAVIMVGAILTNLTHPPIGQALRPILFLLLVVVLWRLRERGLATPHSGNTGLPIPH